MPQDDAEGFQLLISNKWEKTVYSEEESCCVSRHLNISNISYEKYSEKCRLMHFFRQCLEGLIFSLMLSSNILKGYTDTSVL